MDRTSRRRFLQGSLALTGVGLLAGCGVPALPWQPKPRLLRIGYLGPGTSGPYPALLNGFRQGLRDLGYVEGENIVLEYRFTDDRGERLPEFAADLVAQNVDVIVTTGADAAEIARDATSTIPIVGAILGPDPVASGLVASFARPGGNVTGMAASSAPTEIATKRLQILRELIPSMTRTAVLLNPYPTKVRDLEAIQAVAPSLGVQIVAFEARRESDLDAAFQAIAASRPDALMPMQDPLTAIHSARISAFAVEHRLPTMCEVRLWVDAGALMFYGIDSVKLFYRSATFVDRILKGAKPADLPVEQPMHFDLVVNLKAARAIGLTVPPSILNQANEVVQ
jgi:putative ABC transport system substrate-binding protein